MSFPADQHYFHGQGRLYLGDRDGVGGVTKLRFLGNVPKLIIETPQSYDSHTESYTGRRYVDLRVLSETRINVSLILENISYENWVFATKGMFAAEPSASVSDELHLADGGYIALDYKTTAAITSVTSPDGLILYEEGIDYEIAPPSSLLYVIPNSDLAGQPFHVNYLAGDAETIAAIVDHERQYYLYFDGLNTVNRRSLVTVEIFKIQFPIASQLDIISDNFLSLQLDGIALYDVTREADGGFFKVTRETPYLLIADKELVTEGDTFIVSFYGEAPTDYVITGVTSADIDGAPLTGTFTASGEQLTFTVVNADKIFTFSLDNGRASVNVPFVGCEPLEVNFSNPLSSHLTVFQALTDGVYTGATYNLDTSGGFWRTTLTYGNNDGIGYAARIEWETGWSYTPQYANEIISINWQAECRAISFTKNGSPYGFGGNSFPFGVFAVQNESAVGTAEVGPGGADAGGVATEWTLKTGSGNLSGWVVGVPIVFYLVRRNSNGPPDYTTSVAVMDYRNAQLTINVGCG